MAVVVLASASGAPGVTTTALGLSLTWPRHVLLADCDRDPSQSIQAGYLGGMDAAGRGLGGLAQLHRQGAALAPELWRHTLPLTSGGPVQRRLLPGFTSAGACRLFEHVWTDLGQAFALLDEQGADVIVDAGRVSVTGLPSGLLAVADAVLLCVRSTLRSLAAARIYLIPLEDQLGSLASPGQLGLAVVGKGRPYSCGEISSQFGLKVLSEQVWSPKSAAVLSDGDDEPRRFASGPFMGAFRADATRLAEQITDARRVRAALLEPSR